MMETYRCIHCNIEVEGAREWVLHLSSQDHHDKVIRPALQTYDEDEHPAQPYRGDPDDYRDSRRNGDFPSRDDYWD
jgi:hypothetical protein